MFSTRPTTQPTQPTPAGRGGDAPRFDGVDDLLDDSRSRLARVTARAAYQEVPS